MVLKNALIDKILNAWQVMKIVKYAKKIMAVKDVIMDFYYLIVSKYVINNVHSAIVKAIQNAIN